MIFSKNNVGIRPDIMPDIRYLSGDKIMYPASHSGRKPGKFDILFMEREKRKLINQISDILFLDSIFELFLFCLNICKSIFRLLWFIHSSYLYLNFRVILLPGIQGQFQAKNRASRGYTSPYILLLCTLSNCV